MKPLEQTLKNLKNLGEPISVAALYALSELDKTQLEQVKAVWNTLPADRRATTMQHLVDLGDDSFEVDFNTMFRLGLHDADPVVRAEAIRGLWEDVDPALIAPILAHVAEEARTDPELVKSAPHHSTIHTIDHEPLDDPAQWAVTWRGYLRKVGRRA